ncbi:unnamed protein product [Urochloa decumbens]|uniref:Polysaccharide biosynthesis domain-containing protein n=1 Tax=Urochloa decumbens TaxID=240449 RepID=A0ABC9AYA8_9POAL
MTSPMLARKAKLKTHLVSAKAKLKLHVTPRRVVLLAAAAFSAFLILSTIRTLHLHHSAPRRAATAPAAVVRHTQHQKQGEECGKAAAVPAPVAAALVHYATTGETPRQTEAEAGAAARVLAARAPCNLLVFGLGPSAALWAALNHGGRTLFLDTDADGIAAARAAHPAGAGELHAHPVAFHTAAITDELLALRNSSDCAAAAAAAKPLSPEHVERPACALAPRGLPAAFYEAEWDVIVVETPVPGAIYTAAVAARARRPGTTGETTTDVLVHGVDGAAEEGFVRAFLCGGYVMEEAGRLRHFAIPSHRDDKEAMPFCP